MGTVFANLETSWNRRLCPKAILLKERMFRQLPVTSHHAIVARPSSAQQLHAAVGRSVVMQECCMPQLACRVLTRRRSVGMCSSPMEITGSLRKRSEE